MTNLKPAWAVLFCVLIYPALLLPADSDDKPPVSPANVVFLLCASVFTSAGTGDGARADDVSRTLIEGVVLNVGLGHSESTLLDNIITLQN